MSSLNQPTFRIATRASRLALWQAEHVSALVQARHPGLQTRLVHVATQADKDQTTALPRFGGQGAFTREVQHAVLEGKADLAVHSLKDLPTQVAPGLVLAAVPQRGDTADCLVLPNDCRHPPLLEALPRGARVGTGSPRRRAQLLHVRPDLNFHEVRGNVETRLRKLDRGDVDALVLAVAGLTRLGLPHRISCRLEPPAWYPAVGQGALGVECRADDGPCRELLSLLSDEQALAATTAERALLARLRAGCHAPVGARTGFDQGELWLEAAVLSPDGQTRLTERGSGPASDATSLGEAVADRLLARGAQPLIARQ